MMSPQSCDMVTRLTVTLPRGLVDVYFGYRTANRVRAIEERNTSSRGLWSR